MNIRFTIACVLVVLAAAGLQAKPKAAAWGIAAPAPVSANVFIMRGSAGDEAFPSVQDKMDLDAGISYFSWVAFRRAGDGTFSLGSDSAVGGMVAQASAVDGVPGLYAARIQMAKSAASGGKRLRSRREFSRSRSP